MSGSLVSESSNETAEVNHSKTSCLTFNVNEETKQQAGHVFTEDSEDESDKAVSYLVRQQILESGEKYSNSHIGDLDESYKVIKSDTHHEETFVIRSTEQKYVNPYDVEDRAIVKSKAFSNQEVTMKSDEKRFLLPAETAAEEDSIQVLSGSILEVSSTAASFSSPKVEENGLHEEHYQSGWRKQWSNRKKRPYFFNIHTGQSCWNVPSGSETNSPVMIITNPGPDQESKTESVQTVNDEQPKSNLTLSYYSNIFPFLRETDENISDDEGFHEAEWCRECNTPSRRSCKWQQHAMRKKEEKIPYCSVDFSLPPPPSLWKCPLAAVFFAQNLPPLNPIRICHSPIRKRVSQVKKNFTPSVA